MRKFGFTLAEVLLTLGIVGVIAALTIPSLIDDTQGAQVGPKLGKAVAMFEQANMELLRECNTDSLSDAGFVPEAKKPLSEGATDAQIAAAEAPIIASVVAYMTRLSNYLKMSQYNGSGYKIDKDLWNTGGINSEGKSWVSKDGILYWVNFWGLEGNGAPHTRRIGAVIIDINGALPPNLPGTDVFAFRFKNDGSLTPVGSRAWNGNDDNNSPTWRANCPNDGIPTAGKYYTCTASIFENNMKVMYKMR